MVEMVTWQSTRGPQRNRYARRIVEEVPDVLCFAIQSSGDVLVTLLLLLFDWCCVKTQACWGKSGVLRNVEGSTEWSVVLRSGSS